MQAFWNNNYRNETSGYSHSTGQYGHYTEKTPSPTFPVKCWHSHPKSKTRRGETGDARLKGRREHPVGLLSQNPFLAPCFLFVGNRLWPPWTTPSSEGQIRTVAKQEREGIQRQERNSQETIVEPWDRVQVLPQKIHAKTSLNSSQNQNPQQMEDASIFHSRWKEPEILIRLPEIRLKKCRPYAHTPPDLSNPTLEPITIKLLCKSSWWQEPTLPPFACKAIMLFSTSPQTLSPRFNLAPVHRPNFQHQFHPLPRDTGIQNKL